MRQFTPPPRPSDYELDESSIDYIPINPSIKSPKPPLSEIERGSFPRRGLGGPRRERRMGRLNHEDQIPPRPTGLASLASYPPVTTESLFRKPIEKNLLFEIRNHLLARLYQRYHREKNRGRKWLRQG